MGELRWMDRVALLLCRVACWLFGYHEWSEWWQMTEETEVRQCRRCLRAEERAVLAPTWIGEQGNG
jgi:hypothetical protein